MVVRLNRGTWMQSDKSEETSKQPKKQKKSKSASTIIIRDSSEPVQAVKKLDSSIFGIIRSAMQEKKVLSFMYKGQRRNVEPYKLSDTGLHAFCLNASGIRLFKLEFIESPSVIDETPFEPRWDVEDTSTLHQELTK